MIDDLDFDQVLNLKYDSKKYANKKTLKAGLKKVATAMLYTALGLMIIPEATNAIKIQSQNYKTDSQIVEDAQYFNADMRVSNYFASANFLTKTNFKRLAHNNDNPIYVAISNNFDNNEKLIINNVLDYYEDLFLNINSHYKFKVVSEVEAYLQSLTGKNVIYYQEKNLKVNGLNVTKPNLLNFNFTKDSTIKIEKDITDEVEEYYIFMHETAHAFGLGDVYTSSVRHYDTFMYGSHFAQEVKMLYPNDVAMLYAMYCEDFRSGREIDQNKLLQAQTSFENYKDLFYDKAFQSISGNYAYANEIDEEAVNNNIFSFTMMNYNENSNNVDYFKYKFAFNNEKDMLLSITDQQNNELWQTTTNYDFYNGSIFMPSVYFSSGQYPSQDNDNPIKTTEFFAISKVNGAYVLFAPDSNFTTVLTTSDKTLEAFGHKNNMQTPKVASKLEKSIVL